MGELLSPDLLEVLSLLLLDLVAACDALPFQEFQQEALRLLGERVPFDSALWLAGTVSGHQQPAILGTFLYNQPGGMPANLEQAQDGDLPVMQALARPGATVNIALADVVAAEGGDAMRGRAGGYGGQHILATATRGPVSNLVSVISLHRVEPARPFSEPERRLKQGLMPHLVMLCNRSRIQHLEEALYLGRDRRRHAAALADASGLLHHANPGFISLLLAEWPVWQGPVLPPALSAVLAGAPTAAVPFARIAVRVSAVNDLFLLHLREVERCDALSQREWDVASAFGSGMSHKEIARQLGIAPGTVRNHLSTIYEKLDVSNKAELAHSLSLAQR